MRSLIIIFAVITVIQCEHQYIDLFSRTGSSGKSIYVDSEIKDLALKPYEFNDQARSSCINGIWMLYENTDFNSKEGDVEASWGSNACRDLNWVANSASSVRYAGDYLDPNAPTVTFFEKVWFQGREKYFTNTKMNLCKNCKSESLIITGRYSWTFYSNPYFEGESVCIRGEPNKPVLMNISNMHIRFEVKSFEIGCLSKNVLEIPMTSQGRMSNRQ